MDVSPFILNRIGNWGVCLTTIVIIIVLMLRHRNKAFYLFPPLFWVFHGLIFYSYWLMSFFGTFGLSFNLQAMNDWGSIFVAHGLWSLLAILAGLLFRFARVIFLPVTFFVLHGGRSG